MNIKYIIPAFFILLAPMFAACSDDNDSENNTISDNQNSSDNKIDNDNKNNNDTDNKNPNTNPSDSDANSNHMKDALETAPDQGKSCKKYSDCSQFCDSFIGYKCSTKCTSDDQCVNSDYFCRADGRCAPKVFETLWEVDSSNMNVEICTKLADDCDFTIDWGDGSEKESYKCPDAQTVKHTYTESGLKHVKITGKYDGFTFDKDSVSLCGTPSAFRGVVSFGPVGIGRPDSYGLFRVPLRTDVISAIDIPDSTKLVNMNRMFEGGMSYFIDGNDVEVQAFNQPIGNWDVSNVTNLTYAFSDNKNFNQDLSQWDISKVEDASGCFYNSGISEQNFCKLIDIPNWLTLNTPDNSAFSENVLGTDYDCFK